MFFSLFRKFMLDGMVIFFEKGPRPIMMIFNDKSSVL